MTVLILAAVNDVLVQGLQLPGHFPRRAVTHRPAFYLPNRRHLGGRAGEKGLVPCVELLHGQDTNIYANSQIAGHPDNGFPGDAHEDGSVFVIGE